MTLYHTEYHCVLYNVYVLYTTSEWQCLSKSCRTIMTFIFILWFCGLCCEQLEFVSAIATHQQHRAEHVWHCCYVTSRLLKVASIFSSLSWFHSRSWLSIFIRLSGQVILPQAFQGWSLIWLCWVRSVWQKSRRLPVLVCMGFAERTARLLEKPSHSVCALSYWDCVMIHRKVTGEDETCWGKKITKLQFLVCIASTNTTETPNLNTAIFLSVILWLSRDCLLIFSIKHWFENSPSFFTHRGAIDEKCIAWSSVQFWPFKGVNSRNFTCVDYIISNSKIVLTTNISRFC